MTREAGGNLGCALGRRGITVTTIDLLMAPCALSHGVALFTMDSDFAGAALAGLIRDRPLRWMYIGYLVVLAVLILRRGSSSWAR